MPANHPPERPADRAALLDLVATLSERVQDTDDPEVDREAVQAALDDLRAALEPRGASSSGVAGIDLLGGQRSRPRVGRGWRAGF